MRAYLKAGIFSFALLAAGVLVSPSAQFQIQRGFNYVYSYLDIIGASSTWKFTPSGTSLLLQASTGGAYSTVGTFTSAGSYGLGTTTLAATDSSSRILQMGNSLAMQNVVGAQAMYGSNVHYDGAWKRIAITIRPSAVRLVNGRLQFHSAVSGGAGDTITNWDTTDVKFAVSADGDVEVGTTSRFPTIKPTAISVADAGTLSLGAAVSGSCTVSYPGDAAIFLLRGTANASALASGSATFTTTKDNASTVNVYYDTDGYYLQNNTGGTLSFRVLCSGG